MSSKYKQYDERQKLIRGKVYTYTWIYTLCFFMVNAIIFESGHEWCSLVNLAFLGILTSLLISSAVLIIKDAYAYIYAHKIMSVLSYSILFLFYIYDIIKNIRQYGFISGGKLTTAVCFLVILPLIVLDLILLIFNYAKDKKEYKKSCKNH